MPREQFRRGKRCALQLSLSKVTMLCIYLTKKVFNSFFYLTLNMKLSGTEETFINDDSKSAEDHIAPSAGELKHNQTADGINR